MRFKGFQPETFRVVGANGRRSKGSKLFIEIPVDFRGTYKFFGFQRIFWDLKDHHVSEKFLSLLKFFWGFQEKIDIIL